MSKIKNIVIKKCEYCEKEFKVNLNLKRESKKRFCGGKCAKTQNGLNNKGKKHTEEWKNKMSIKNSGENNPFYGKSHTNESKKQMSESSKWDESRYKYVSFTDKEKEIFDGIMISDGSLSQSTISARFTLGFKYLQTLERIIEDLPSMSFLEPWKYLTKNKKTNCDSLHFFTKSNSYRNLYFEYERWYPNGEKIIPKDYILTSISSYWWYVCDGYISRDVVYLCTDSFTKDDLIIMVEKFKKLGFRTNVTTRNRIRFYKADSIKFLKWISQDVKIQQEYLYKWKKSQIEI